MKNTLHFIPILLSISIYSIYACQQKVEINENKSYFNIDPKDRQIVLSVSLNDSIKARLGFDTGGYLILDSSFCATHPDVMHNLIPDTILQSGSGWTKSTVSSFIYNNAPTVKIGDKKMMYDGVKIYNWKKYMNTTNSEGIINIPYNDSTYVWELNFEHGYMEIHTAYDFKIPQNSFIFPLVKKKEYPSLLYVKLPIKVKSSDNTTMTMKRLFMIDTGMAWDMVLMSKAEEFAFFNKQENTVWTKYLRSYHRYCTVDATLSDSFDIDSLRIYTFDNINIGPSHYLIGQNFLKRFNVFFDMKHRQLGLQPVSNFRRIINPLHRRFHLSVEMNSQKNGLLPKWLIVKETIIKTQG